MPTRRIACLAASLKHGGFCYAGKDIDNGEWVRPVSDDDTRAISAYYRVVGKGDPAKVGDVLEMDVGDHVPLDFQTENYEHVKKHWRRLGTFTAEHALELKDEPDSLWGRGRSTHYGVHDELSQAEASDYQFSLCLIEVYDLVVLAIDEGYQKTRKRIRANFTYNGVEYRLRVTDPEYFDHDFGNHKIGSALLCCSLAEPFEWDDGSKHCSKLVAAILPL